MDYHNILAAKLNLDLNYKKMYDEILSCKEAWIYIPPKEYQIVDALENRVFKVTDEQTYLNTDYIDKNNNIIAKGVRGSYTFCLRFSNDAINSYEKFTNSKFKNISEFQWHPDLIDKISYTKEVIESMFSEIGIVRIFVTKDTYIPAHKDYIVDDIKFYDMKYYSKDYEKVLGLSLIPSTGDVPMKIYSRLDKKIVEIPGNAMLFNDSVFHGVSITTGYRITLRIFGKIDYSQFDNKLDMDHTYFLKNMY